MKTIKLPIIIDEADRGLLAQIQREASSCFRWSFNRHLDGKTNNEQTAGLKTLSFEYLNSWMIRSIIVQTGGQCDAHKATGQKQAPCFRRYAFNQFNKNKITKEELKQQRLIPIWICGEASKHGNRMIELSEKEVTFKYTKAKHFVFKLPHLRKNHKNLLNQLADAMKHNKLAVTISLSPSKSSISIIFDETKLQPNNTFKIKNRVLGIDLNPDWIGWSIIDVKDNEEIVVDSGSYELTNLHKKDNNHIKGHRNKINHETIEICHDLKEKFTHYKCENVVVEELDFSPKSLGSKGLNRKCKNQFNHSFFIKKIKMLCPAIEVNPAYSSLIGNLKYEFHDPVNASIEIGRRGVYKFNKGMFHPPVGGIKPQWKQVLTTNSTTSWKTIFDQIKTLNLRYRVQLDQLNNHSCFQFKSTKSKIKQFKHNHHV